VESDPHLFRPGNVTAATRREAAQLIAERLERLADGRDKHCPNTWEAVAKSLNLSVRYYHELGLDRGFSMPRIFCDSGLVGGGIGINTAYTEREQCEAWVHELAHMILAAWLPPQLTESADACCYIGDHDEVAHDISRITEQLILIADANIDEERKRTAI